ncbi:MAG TPA: flagellar basal body rod C-terminal domain-containing protein [Tepidisphaeraceae bacterium]|jgi:flagellar hook protein FlgE
MSGLNAIFSTALSGLNAAGVVLDTTASNVANLDSRGYKAARANLAEAPRGGVEVSSVTRDPSPGVLDDQGEELSNVDLASEMVHLREGAVLYRANAVVVRVADQMTGTLLDMFDTDRGRRQ